MKQIVQEQTRRVIDNYTGEIIDETVSKTFSIKKGTEPFFLTYSRYMSILYNFTSLTAVKILWKFLENAQYNTGLVLVPAGMKKEIIRDLDISESIYMKSIKTLIDNKLLSGGRGVYKLNPEIHWKGDYRAREALLKAGCKLTIAPDTPDEFDVK